MMSAELVVNQLATATPSTQSSLPNVYPPGTILGGQYRVEAQLKSGVNVCTFKCVSCSDEAIVVVKMFQVGSRVCKELEKSAQRLLEVRQRGIPRYINYFILDSNFCLVQNYVEGLCLAEITEQRQLPTEEQGLRIMKELLCTLTQLTDRRPPLAHGNINDENIILEGGSFTGRTHLISFACNINSRKSFSDDVMAEGEDGSYTRGTRGICTPQHDIFNLGVVLWSMFSGLRFKPLTVESVSSYFAKKSSPSNEIVELICRMLDSSSTSRITADEAFKLVTTLSVQRQTRPQPNRTDPPIAAYPPQGVPISPDPTQSFVRETEDSLQIIIPLRRLSWLSKWTPSSSVSCFGTSVGATLGCICSTVLLSQKTMHLKFTSTSFCITRSRRSPDRQESEFLPTVEQINQEANSRSRRGEYKGAIVDLHRVQVFDGRSFNGDCHIELRAFRKKKFEFGNELDKIEQKWLVHKINSFVNSHRRANVQ